MARVGFDLRSECGDTTIDAAIVHDQVVAPDRIEDLVTCEGTAGSAKEKLEQSKFFGGERNRLALLKKLASDKVDLAQAEIIAGAV